MFVHGSVVMVSQWLKFFGFSLVLRKKTAVLCSFSFGFLPML